MTMTMNIKPPRRQLAGMPFRRPRANVQEDIHQEGCNSNDNQILVCKIWDKSWDNFSTRTLDISKLQTRLGKGSMTSLKCSYVGGGL